MKKQSFNLGNPDEDPTDYRLVSGLEKFKKLLNGQNFFSKGILGLLLKFAAYFIFEILKISEQFLKTKIYFEYNSQSKISSRDNNLLQELIYKGIIKRISRGLTDRIYYDEPRLYHYNAVLGDISLYSDAKKQCCHNASGTSSDSSRHAFLRTVGEAVERFCLDCYRGKDLVVASYAELKNEAIDPASVAALSFKQRGQNHLFEISGKSVFRWIKGQSLKTGKPHWIPTQLVYVAYNQIPQEPLIMMPISTGAAAWTSLEGAIYRGLCEAVERDAFMVNYLNKIAVPRFNLGKITNPLLKNLYHTLSRYQLELHLLDITTDILVPTILAIILDRTGIGPSISIGTSANLDIFRAMEGAILEALKIRISKRRLFDKTPNELKIQPAEIVNFNNRKLFWRDPDLVKKLDFWFSGPVKELAEENQKEFGDDSQNLKTVLNYLNDLDIESFMVDITIPLIRKAGFFVVKTVTPKLQPLYLNENLRYLNGGRLYQVPVKMGWRKESLKEEELNSLPHPFI